MKCLLFRKLVLDGINYYQFYKIENDFILSDDYAEFESRETKDFFYLEIEGDRDLGKENLYCIFYDNEDKELMPINDVELYEKVFNEFKKHFPDMQDKLLNIIKIKQPSELIELVNDRVMFQSEVIEKLVQQIYTNNSIVSSSSLNMEIKARVKSNILLYGPKGNGKNLIVDSITKNIDFPYADITMEPDIKAIIMNIAKSLIEHSNSDSEASRGIVFIRDNYEQLYDIFDGDVFSVINFISNHGIVEYENHKIDFRTLTFVVLLNEETVVDYGEIEDDDDVNELMSATNCTLFINVPALTKKEKIEILKSTKGRIFAYKRFLMESNHDLTVEKGCLELLVDRCDSICPGMHFINSTIDSIMKLFLEHGIVNVCITKKIVNKILDVAKECAEEKSNKPVKENVEELSRGMLKDEVCKTVIGQDAAVKRIIYILTNNFKMARVENLQNPKEYIPNILIHGESGSGKNLIISTILEKLGVPYYIADATRYSETGYVGKDVDQMLCGLLESANGDLELAQKGVLVVNEIDKKAERNDEKSGVSRGAVQDSLLTVTEGSVITINIGTSANPNEIEFNTSRLTVICCGAFEDIEKKRDARVKKAMAGSIGFDNKRNDVIIDKRIIDADYVAYGMGAQFIARFPIIVDLNKNTVESLKGIMLHSSISYLAIQKKILETNGITLEYTDDFIDALALKAFNYKIGARGIKRALEDVFSNIHIEDIEPQQVQKIILSKEAMDNPEKLVIVPRVEEEKVKKKKISYVKREN